MPGQPCPLGVRREFPARGRALRGFARRAGPRELEPLPLGNRELRGVPLGAAELRAGRLAGAALLFNFHCLWTFTGMKVRTARTFFTLGKCVSFRETKCFYSLGVKIFILVPA